MERKQKCLQAGIAAGFLFLMVFIAGIVYSYQNRVYKTCIFEAGTNIEAEDFLKDTSKEITFVNSTQEVDTTVLGTYTIKLKSGFFYYQCQAVVQDTIAPIAEAVDVYFEEGQTITPELFVTNIEDITDVTVEYVKEPDKTVYGKQNVEVVLTDAGNNQVVISSNLITRATVQELEAEAGSNFPELDEFLISKTEEAEFITLTESIDMSKIGDYNIEISMNGMVYTTILHLKDTTPPVVEGKNHTAYTTDTVTCENFIQFATDVTQLTYTFIKEPNMTQTGEQTVSILVTDEGGNSVQKDMKLTVLKDTTPPVITGAKDFTAFIGDSISYKNGIKVTDNHDSSISLKVDTSKVNTKEAGTYPITYSAVDAAGNETTVTVNLKLVEKEYTESALYVLADEVLAKIIKDGMSEYEKLKAIYNYVRGSIFYTNSSENKNWIKAAFCGLADKKGDCYTYACTAKALLTRAGIKNKDIQKIPTSTNHYWNLVDIGDGWYHFDTTPRKGQSISFCYISDADLMAYSNSHYRSHNYDRNVYTDIN